MSRGTDGRTEGEKGGRKGKDLLAADEDASELLEDDLDDAADAALELGSELLNVLHNVAEVAVAHGLRGALETVTEV